MYKLPQFCGVLEEDITPVGSGSRPSISGEVGL
ncbi:MAG: hypothetical protein ACQZ3M_00305 [cyanobacterium endosymbiont of Rhopalodia fuxianensis]